MLPEALDGFIVSGVVLVSFLIVVEYRIFVPVQNVSTWLRLHLLPDICILLLKSRCDFCRNVGISFGDVEGLGDGHLGSIGNSHGC